MEGRRLAGYVLDPGQIDPKLTRFVPYPTFPLRDSDALSVIFPDQSTQLIARRQGMYAGYSATRSDPSSKASMVLAVFVFPSAGAAQKAATGMANSSKDVSDTVLKYPDLPGAIGNQGAAGTTAFSGQVFIASGQSVVYVYVNGGISQKATVPGRMKTALTRQLAALKAYSPTPKNALMKQEFDPTGLYARTLPPAKNYVQFGMYSGQGALHSQADALATAKLFSSTGVDVVAKGRSVLYRAKDAAGATAVRDAFYAQEVAMNSRYRDFDPGTTAGSPRCLQDSVQSQYVCYATVDRVTIEYSSLSETDLKRSLETQVALLQQ
ncbi:hypothetical protein ABLG96_06600 [Nakamurella sp. A5-74]|uniref:Uncharacterized protein n=1 Tax=Nakamurella sp. A5-74 TaxID=3158264 RepID=A0AAU8DRN9_9ACTN